MIQRARNVNNNRKLERPRLYGTIGDRHSLFREVSHVDDASRLAGGVCPGSAGRQRAGAVGDPHLRRPVGLAAAALRSEERRVGEEGRSRWWPDHLKKK